MTGMPGMPKVSGMTTGMRGVAAGTAGAGTGAATISGAAEAAWLTAKGICPCRRFRSLAATAGAAAGTGAEAGTVSEGARAGEAAAVRMEERADEARCRRHRRGTPQQAAVSAPGLDTLARQALGSLGATKSCAATSSVDSACEEAPATSPTGESRKPRADKHPPEAAPGISLLHRRRPPKDGLRSHARAAALWSRR